MVDRVAIFEDAVAEHYQPRFAHNPGFIERYSERRQLDICIDVVRFWPATLPSWPRTASRACNERYKTPNGLKAGPTRNRSERHGRPALRLLVVYRPGDAVDNLVCAAVGFGALLVALPALEFARNWLLAPARIERDKAVEDATRFRSDVEWLQADVARSAGTNRVDW